MKITKNYKGGNLNEKVCKVFFKYKGSMSIFNPDELSWGGMVIILEYAREVDILCNAESILKMLDSFYEKFKNGCEISEREKSNFERSVYLFTKIGLIENDEDNGMVVFTK